LPNFNPIWSFWTDFHTEPQYKISMESSWCEPCWYVWMDRQDTANTHTITTMQTRLKKLC